MCCASFQSDCIVVRGSIVLLILKTRGRTVTQSRGIHSHLGGAHRDMVEIDLGNNQRGMAVTTSNDLIKY